MTHQVSDKITGLDPTFGDAGRVTLLAQGYLRVFAYDVVTTNDDAIIVALTCHRESDTGIAYSFGAARLGADGVIDRTFGTDGFAIYPFADDGHCIEPYTMPNGGILLRCTTGKGVPMLVRLRPDGSLDESFSDKGIRHFDLDDHDLLGAEAFPLDDGRIVLIGKGRRKNDQKPEGMIIRLLDDGRFDTTLNQTGILAVAFPGSAEENVQCGVIQGEKFVLAGSTDTQAFIRRYLPDGTLDTTFGVEGEYTVVAGDDINLSRTWFDDLLLTAKGELIGLGTDSVAGSGDNRREFGFLVGIDADGHPNPDFAGGQLIHTPERIGTSRLKAGEFDGAANVVVSGVLGGITPHGFLLGRYSAAGLLDADFGEQGFMYIGFGEAMELARGFTVQGDRGILLSGQVVSATRLSSEAIVLRVKHR